MIPQSTPYPDVNAVLDALLSSVQGILGDNFLGMYLDGSLAGGDFDPQSSDIDFVVVTTDELPEAMVQALGAMHKRLSESDSKWGWELEGSYIPQHALRRHDPAHATHPHIERGESLRVEQHDADWIVHRHVLRERGVALEGPPPKTLIDSVQPDELRRAVSTLLRQWWEPMIDDPTRLHGRGYQPYAVLTMCRALYTLEHGTIVSKPVAAQWAQEALDGRWTPLIKQALIGPGGDQANSISETQEFIRYTLERSKQYMTPADTAAKNADA